MLRILWVPKKYKHFSFTEMVEHAESLIKDAKELQVKSARTYGDVLVLQNHIANLSEDEARKNLEVIVPWCEEYLKLSKEE